MTSVRQRSPRGQGGKVRDELVAAAEALLVERGSAAAVTVADIVGRVGVTPPVLYAHFPDKDALFVAVHARRMQDFQDTLQKAARRGTSAIDALERRGRAYVRFATARPDSYRALFMAPSTIGEEIFVDPNLRGLTAYDDLVENIRSCIEEGSIPSGDVDLKARVAWAHVHGLATMLVTMPAITHGVGVRRLTDAVVAAMTAGLQAGDHRR